MKEHNVMQSKRKGRDDGEEKRKEGRGREKKTKRREVKIREEKRRKWKGREKRKERRKF